MSGGLLALSGSISMADEVNEGLVRITDCPRTVPTPSRRERLEPRARPTATARRPLQRRHRPHSWRRQHPPLPARRGHALAGPRLGSSRPRPAPLPASVAYQKWFPDPWTGHGRPLRRRRTAASMVYIPDRHDQLGYYYPDRPPLACLHRRDPGPPEPAASITTSASSRARRHYCPPSAGSTVRPTPAATTPSPVPADGPRLPAPAPPGGLWKSPRRRRLWFRSTITRQRTGDPPEEGD